jgi:cytochrome c-type biogenesis protein CcmE
VARSRSPARLVVALSVAAALAVFLLYTSLAGGGTPAVKPSELPGHRDTVQLSGRVLKPVTGDAHAGGLRFRLRDVSGTASVSVVYTGTVGDQFKAGRDILVRGRLRKGVFVAEPNSMITKCPSKYAPKKNA